MPERETLRFLCKLAGTRAEGQLLCEAGEGAGEKLSSAQMR